jgi:anaerobic selenocysteine-containing dehydrogenase
MRNWNMGYLQWARHHRLIRYAEPVLLHIYSEVLQKFKLAAEGKTKGRQPPDALRERIKTFMDPLPFYYAPLEWRYSDPIQYPLSAITQRPMAMYHSWDSQNAWLRQIHTDNYLVLHPSVGKANAFEDGDWIWVESQWGKVRCRARFSESVEPGTVWTWNAIGKASGNWGLTADANESKKGFLLNHLISEEIPCPAKGKDAPISNSDPVTGQAAWYDVRVKVYKADPHDPEETWPQFSHKRPLPGMVPFTKRVRQFFAGRNKEG